VTSRAFRQLLGIALGIGLLMAPATARAGVFDIFGFGSRNVAMGGAATASVDDHTAVFYNPAGLTQRKVIHLGLSFASYIQNLSIEHRNPGDESLEARAPESPIGVGFGVVFPLGGKIDNRVALGLAIYLPVARALRLEALEPSTPRWYRYNTLADKLHILASVAVEITDWVSVGVGIQALADLDGRVDLELDLTNERITRRDASVQLVTTAMPVVGLLFTPLEGWRIGLSYRAALSLSYEIPLVFDFGEAADLVVDISGTDLYTPHTITLGTAYDFEDAGVLVSLDAELALWSYAPDPSLRVAVRGEGTLLEELGLGDLLNLQPGRVPDAGFSDAITIRAGTEYTPLDWLLLRAGAFWRQSAVAPQTGATTYLDSDAIGGALGGAITFPDPLEIDERPFLLDIFASITGHPTEVVDKEDPGNPIGRTTFGGQVYGLGASLRHDF